jgi:D-3-phosphoglycerate dehydrogenase / 2-oxoglutarate reductase
MNILIASSIHKDAIQKLEQEHDVICAFNAKDEELKALIADREVLIFRSGVQITADVMSRAPRLKLLLRAGSGVDNIDVDYVEERGLRLIRIPGPGGKAVAELSFAFMLALSRNLLKADQLTRQGHFAKSQLTGYLLTGKTLGIIGVGNIGSRVAHLGRAWGMKVTGCVEFPTPARAETFLQQDVYLTGCKEVLQSADFISIHVPLKASTRYLIDAQALSYVKPEAILVNLARGGVVDESALLAALQEGRLRGAALDVHEAEGEGKVSPLADLPNVILTPHIGAGTFDSQREIGEIVLQAISEHTAAGTGIKVEQAAASPAQA